MRHLTQYLPLYAALAYAAACSERSPSMPLSPDVPITRSASVNRGAPSPVDSEEVQSGLCTFDVRLHANGKGKMLVVGKDQSITLFTAPTLEVTLTNVDDPEMRVTVGITGAFHVTTDADGNSVYMITGRNLIHRPDAGLLLTRGVFTYTLDADGNIVQPLSGRGQTTDLCALLSA
ncbi:MAG TPA: hypothetical protein VLN49_23825 [Gemmatimonadaceae bacterium]|nr:hypothetical protein [Gemmatimonadaceae bacterium]